MASETVGSAVDITEEQQPLQLSATKAQENRRQSCWTRFLSWCDNGWFLEYLSLFTAYLLLLALSILLQKFNGLQIPHFGNGILGALTLGTIVTIIGTAIQACMMYPIIECLGQLKWQRMHHGERCLDELHIIDQAGRGTWGALKLLCSMRGLRATSGSALIVLAVAVIPLFQQMVSYETRSSTIPASKASATSLILQKWEDYPQGPQTSKADSSQLDDSSVSLPMRGAIQAGLFSLNQSILPLEPFCSTSNCTFATYQSLAVCASVTNLTASVKHDIVDVVTEAGTFKGVQYTLRNNYTLLPTISPSSRYVANVTMSRDTTLAFTDKDEALNSLITSAIILSAPGAFILRDYTPTCFAYEIGLHFCVQNFTTTVSNGISNTKVAEVSRAFRCTRPGISRLSSLYQNGSISAAGFPGSMYGNYTIGLKTLLGLQNYFRNILPGSVNRRSVNSYATSDAVQLLYWPHYSDTTNVTLEFIMNNVATSMTNHLRRSGLSLQNQEQDPATATVIGTAYDNITVVIVRWYWMIGPGVLALLTTIFVASVTMQSRQGMFLWKSSSRALMHSIDPSLYLQMKGLGTVAELQQEDSTSKVKLVLYEKSEWRLDSVHVVGPPVPPK